VKAQTSTIIRGLRAQANDGRLPLRHQLAAFVAILAALLIALSLWIKGDSQ